jgi:hypothetical protein
VIKEVTAKECYSCGFKTTMLIPKAAPSSAIDESERLLCEVCVHAPHRGMTLCAGASQHDYHCFLILKCLFYCTRLLLSAIRHGV